MLPKEFIKLCNYAEITLGRLNPLIPLSLCSLCCERVSGLGPSYRSGFFLCVQEWWLVKDGD